MTFIHPGELCKVTFECVYGGEIDEPGDIRINGNTFPVSHRTAVTVEKVQPPFGVGDIIQRPGGVKVTLGHHAWHSKKYGVVSYGAAPWPSIHGLDWFNEPEQNDYVLLGTTTS